MLEPIGIPTLDSNYVWVLPIEGTREAYVVDPGDAAPVLEALNRLELSLSAILVTHHHWDHTDGLEGMLDAYSVPVYGPNSVPEVTHRVRDGDQLTLPGLSLSVLAVPGHTLDHLAYFWAGTVTSSPRLFCGDALFAGGCGRLFEGTPAMALASIDRIDQLPANTRIYCAHEYTQTNLRFARSVDPDNDAIRRRLAEVEALRTNRQPTLPTELALERATNLFLRTSEPDLRAALGLPENTDRSTVFAELRRRKDRFR